MSELQAVVLVGNLIEPDARTAGEFANLDVPLYESSEEKVLGFILGRSFYQLVQREHHDEGIEVLFIEGEVNLREIPEPDLFPDQNDGVRSKATRHHNDDV